MIKILVIATALTLNAYPSTAQHSSHTMVNESEIQWKEGPPVLEGTKAALLYGDPSKDGLFVMRIKFPANYRVPPHTHPVDEIITVISGEFNLGTGKEFNEALLKQYRAGALIAMPPRMEHFVFTKQETVVQISTRGPWGLNFVNPTDKAQVYRQ